MSSYTRLGCLMNVKATFTEGGVEEDEVAYWRLLLMLVANTEAAKTGKQMQTVVYEHGLKQGLEE